MLVLSRKTNETIVVADEVKFTVLGIKGDRVRIGVEAPDHVRIRRAELALRDDRVQFEVTSHCTIPAK